ncbi:MAG: hypothetical protein EPN43_00225 [Jatrophihabitans sp.]|nr:MAG: hypothetical protein EPN43_00225 [Jatrophihabitans sp.]
MSDQALARVDALLSELVDTVETARAVPMSSSCVLPRERMLDLLDELRDVLPLEMIEARRIVATKDAVLHEAYEQAREVRERSVAEADTVMADARHHAQTLVDEAQGQVRDALAASHAEHAQLVSSTGVHQAAARAAAELRAAAESYDTAVRSQADHYAEQVRGEADRYDDEVRTEADRVAAVTREDVQRYAAKLAGDAEAYTDHTLAELVATLRSAAQTADQGRAALAARRRQPEQMSA